ncbi:MAG: hypothetical protein WBI18_04765, partial [Candidatus Saccharicenans sp.]
LRKRILNFKGGIIKLEHYAEVVDQICSKIETSKATIKKTESYLHKQLRSGAPVEQFSDYYSLLDSEEGRLSGLNEALRTLQSELLNYHLSQL